jgi:hypothetical protein
MSNNFTQHHRYRSFGSSIRSSLLLHQIRRHWMKPVFIIAVGAVISQKDLSIDMQFNARQGIQESNISFIPRLFSSNEQNSSNNETIKAVNTSLLSGREAPQKIKEPPRTVTTEVQQIPRSQNISQVSSTYKPSPKEMTTWPTPTPTWGLMRKKEPVLLKPPNGKSNWPM